MFQLCDGGWVIFNLIIFLSIKQSDLGSLVATSSDFMNFFDLWQSAPSCMNWKSLHFESPWTREDGILHSSISKYHAELMLRFWGKMKKPSLQVAQMQPHIITGGSMIRRTRSWSLHAPPRLSKQTGKSLPNKATSLSPSSHLSALSFADQEVLSFSANDLSFKRFSLQLVST